MGKIVRLRDVGCECRGLLRAETEEGLLKAVAVHATKVHGMQVQGVTPDFVEKVRTAIREEEFRFWWPREAGDWWGSPSPSRLTPQTLFYDRRQRGQNAVPDLLDRLTTALQDRYRIERELRAGGMATVYLAEDLKHHRKVAVKVLRPELAAAIGPERFLREILQGFSHRREPLLIGPAAPNQAEPH